MKKNILKFSMVAIIGTFTLLACSGSDSPVEDHENHNEEVATVEYFCPMKCEGEKTYSEAGSCPKCGMDLTIDAE